MANLHESTILTEAIICAELEPFKTHGGHLAIETENPIKAITEIIRAANPHEAWDVADWCGKAKTRNCHIGPMTTVYFPGFRLAVRE